MVAIGRALMSNPKVLLCDEISLGLAPVVIKDIYAAVPKIQESGASLIVVEQDIGQAMKVADRVYCMMEGRVTLEGTPDTLSRDDIHAAYFGGAHEGPHGFAAFGADPRGARHDLGSIRDLARHRGSCLAGCMRCLPRGLAWSSGSCGW
jgi:ABC-type transporter Mla maintaining outer membrane lipid asymmetry ATPase subunit MlaF